MTLRAASALVIAILLLSACATSHTKTGHSSPPPHTCAPGSVFTVTQLFDYCTLPGDCSNALACEGKTVFVSGSVDFDNVFEHRSYPQLPYEKFFLNAPDSRTLEIVAVSRDNVALFDKIFTAKGNGRKEVLVKGTIRGIDLPIMGACRRGIRLETRSADSIRFR
jgi:hypothetical protein